MPLQLSPRRVSMLKEMGITVWALPERTEKRSAAQAQTMSPYLAKPQPSATVSSFAKEVVSERLSPAPTAIAKTASAKHEANRLQPQPQLQPHFQPLPSGIEEMDWSALETAVTHCQACGLCQTRKQALLGEGDREADIFILSDLPTENEDQQGHPFTDRGGQLLDNMLAAVRLDERRFSRTATEGGVYITHAIKCHPSAGSAPTSAELAQCATYWQRQVALVQPRVILALGSFAARSILNSSAPLGQLRAKSHTLGGIPVVVSYHPDYLLRNPLDKAKAWEDLCQVRQHLLGLDSSN